MILGSCIAIFNLILNGRLKSSVLIKKGEIEGSFASSDETPAAIAEEYERLFGQGRRNLVRVSKSDELTGKILANHLFKVNTLVRIMTDIISIVRIIILKQGAYEECRQAVLQEMFKELFCHHVPGTEQLAASRMKLKAHYGQLLHLKKACIDASVDASSLALKVLRSIKCKVAQSFECLIAPMY